LFRKGKHLFGLAAFAALASLGLAACGGGPHTLALVGSDTTSGVMGAISSSFNSSSSPDTASNVPPTLGASQSFTVPSDKRCGQVVYHGTNNPPPNGSTAGISALSADTTGCVDIARSSRDKRDTDPANLEFYAFAKDAVTWVRWANACPGSDAGPAGCAPNTLTQAQLQGIYLCTQGGAPGTRTPLFTNWSQVGGDDEPIARYLAQPGSGTYAFFASKILGLSTAQQNVVDDSDCAPGSKPTRVQESTGSAIAAGDRPAAIVNYSFANWTAQSNGVETDTRAGALLAQINGVTPNATTINNGTFLGRRWVNNVVKNGSPSYGAAIDFVGVDSGGNGFLCNPSNGDANFIIALYGFVGNPTAPAGTGLPNSRCRKNPAPL
jgi:phosphate transport system substrate-binding protein